MTNKEIQDRFTLVLTKKEAARFDDEVATLISTIDSETESDGLFVDKLHSHLDVFAQARTSPEKYVKACEYVMHYGYNRNKKESFALTFPEKVIDMRTRGVADKTAQVANSYFNSQLVQNILAQSAVSLGLMHASKAHDAIVTLHHLAQNSENERIKMESADKLLGHLTIDEKNTFKVQHTHTVKRDFIGEMKEKMAEMVAAQKSEIIAGGDIKTIANAPVVDVEIIED